MGDRLKKALIAVAALAALALGAGALAQAGDENTQGPPVVADDGGPGDSDDQGDSGEVTGSGADKAKAAALRLTGGEANSVERDDENGATWEVEVTKPNGQTVDVRLDEDYDLVVVESDSEE